jgi:DNA processing protein
LIQENKAHLVTCAADIIKILSWEDSNKKPSVQRQLFQDVSPKEAKIIAVLREKKELTADSLSFLMELSMSEIASELLQLEFKGLIRSMPGRRYALIP